MVPTGFLLNVTMVGRCGGPVLAAAAPPQVCAVSSLWRQPSLTPDHNFFPPAISRYSSGVRSLIAQLLKKDPHARPSTGAVLRRPLIKDKIGRFLSEAQVRPEHAPKLSL